MSLEDSNLLHPALGEEYILVGKCKEDPKLTSQQLELLSKLGGANPLITREAKIGNVIYRDVIQEESDLSTMYNLDTQEFILKNFTCGKTAKPTNLSPSINPEVSDICKLAKYKDNVKKPLKRGYKTSIEGALKSNCDYGRYFAVDIFNANSKKLNTISHLEKMASETARILIGVEKPCIKPMIKEFKDKNENIDGYSAIITFYNGTSSIEFYFHTYPKAGVYMGNITSSSFLAYYLIPGILKKLIEGESVKWKVTPRSFLSLK